MQQIAARILEVRPLRLGEILIRLPLVAKQLGHSSLEKTGTYVHPNSPDSEFVCDVVFGLGSGDVSLDEFTGKWFGSEDAMLNFMRSL